jgi:hypothetical protein
MIVDIGTRLYSLIAGHGTFNAAADSTTYYFGMGYSNDPATGQGFRIVIPVAGTIIACAGQQVVGGTLGSGENSTLFIRLNDTSNTNITTTQVHSAAVNTFSVDGLSITVAKDDYITIGWTTPAWVTNPTGVISAATVIVEV